MKRSSHAATAAVVVSTCLAACGADAQTAPFYQGKQLTLLINFTPGGPTDTEGRLVARHLGAHIPGNPAIIARNIPGAGGLIGANYVGEVAPPDGLTLGYFTGFGSKAMMADPALRVNILKFAFVAAGPGISVTYIRSDVPPGLKVPADILKAKDFWAGGLTPDSDKDVRERMELDFLGLHYNYISGYKGSPEARLALQQNEIQMYPESMPTYRSSIEPGLVKTGEVIPVWYDPLDDGENFYKSPDAEGIPALPYDQFLDAGQRRAAEDRNVGRLSPAQCGRHVLPARPRHAAGNAAGRGRHPAEGPRRTRQRRGLQGGCDDRPSNSSRAS